MRTVDFSGKTAVIVCHDAMFGPPHELRDYLLLHKVKNLLFIGHRNRSVPDNHIRASYFELYRNGILIKRHGTRPRELPEFIAYLVDSWQTWWWSFTLSGHVDIFVGLGNLNAFAGLMLRVFGKVSYVVYYVIDYIPDRYGKSFMNSLYCWLDAYCASNSITWNYAPVMIRLREKAWKRKFPHQLVVPNGIHVRPSLIQPFERIHQTEVIYLGTLTEQQGAQLMIEALPAILRVIPSTIFTLIGRGLYRSRLEVLAKKLNVSSHVKFLGFIENPFTMEKRLAKAALGVATYVPNQGFVQNTEPGKVKRYLAVGVPVVMTDVSPLASALVKNKCGFCCLYDEKALAHAVISYLSKKNTMRTYRQNAVKFAKKSQWDTIFTHTFASMEK